MIRRNAAQYTKNQESLKQHSFTAMRGVDATKAPTQPDTVLNTMNLDIDYDGGLILRKPLLFSHRAPIEYTKVHYTYIGEPMYVSDNCISFPIHKYILTDIYGITHEMSNESANYKTFCDFKNAKFVNTATTTLISNVLVDLYKIKSLYGVEVYNSNVESDKQPRFIKLAKKDGEWTLEILTPEINTMSTEDIPTDFNTALNYTYAIRDNYTTLRTNLNKIQAYSISNVPDLEFSSQHVFTYSEDITPTAKSFSYKVAVADLDTSNAEFEVYGFVDDYNVLKQIVVFIPEDSVFRHLTIKVYDKPYEPNIVLDRYFELSSEYAECYLNIPETITLGRGTTTIEILYTYIASEVEKASIDILTESPNIPIIDTLNYEDSSRVIVLKAFIDKPNTNANNIVLKWEYSKDGITWTNVLNNDNMSNSVNSIKFLKIADKLAGLEDTANIVLEPDFGYVLNTMPFEDRNLELIKDRPDCLILAVSKENLEYAYKCTLLSLKEIPDAYEYTGDLDYMVDFTINEVTYYFKKGSFTISSDKDFKNPLSSNFTYWKHSLYGISDTLQNHIYASEVGSAIFPVSRIIDLGTFEGNTVTKLIPWRDYLIAFTENTVHLVKEQEVGFTTKVINTFIGAPQRDADTCVATLNGIVFKSGSKLYSITPNVNSGDETIFNVSEISKPIEHILDKFSYNDEYKPFAFTTPEAYYLFVPSKPDEAGNVNTFCLKYNYTLRVWTQYKYPVLLYKYEMLNVSDIRVFSRTADGIVEYYFEKEPDDVGDLQPYGDFLTTEKDSELGYKISPIEFFVDSGQKTDNLSLTKQFVESKIIVATLSNKDNFEMDVQIAIEGNTFNKHVDINTDGALVRSSSDQILTLGTTSNLTENEDTFNTMRQVFLRYSGRGKTIRHIIKGSSLYKFKIYETFYRFKILNVKQ